MELVYGAWGEIVLLSDAGRQFYFLQSLLGLLSVGNGIVGVMTLHNLLALLGELVPKLCLCCFWRSSIDSNYAHSRLRRVQ